jgi:hypothetical protein
MQAYVKAPNAEAGDMFGVRFGTQYGTLALSGDTLAVGAPGEASCSTSVSATAATDNGCSWGAGAVYVYTRSGTTWSFQAYVKAPNLNECSGSRIRWACSRIRLDERLFGRAHRPL